jgi:hypothetical protein
MRLGRVLMACNLNPEYLDYWPFARRAWLEIVGIEPHLILIAEETEIPAELRSDELVTPFSPVPGVHTALQAQCIRLLYPALIDTTDAVLISDIDLYPLRPSYFLDSIAGLDDRFFVTYRDIYLERQQVSMLFNAAKPSTWSEIFGVETEDDVRSRLLEWTSNIQYDGRRAWPGWFTDQQMLYRMLMQWAGRAARWWALDDTYTRHLQLDRLELEGEDGLSKSRQAAILRQEYSEYVCLFPYRAHRDVNDLVLELGLAAARGTAR